MRVVAIAGGYDSVAEKTPADALLLLLLPVKNLFNDMYCRDASAKTKASLSAKRRRGEFVGAFAPYGYAKGSGPDRGRLVIDPEPAGVVRGIFDARIGGMSAAGIAAMLNDDLVPSPYEYFAAKGAARSANFCKGERTAWDARTVLRILSNEAYAGTLVQGKTCKPDFRRKAVLPVDEPQWNRSPGAHEASPGRPKRRPGRSFGGRRSRSSRARRTAAATARSRCACAPRARPSSPTRPCSR